MENTDWLKAWIDNNIRFHNEEYNTNLVKYWDDFTGGEKGTVFVPLCGKTLDMKYFNENGHNVYGVELSRIAVESFFNENKITYKKDGHLFYSNDIFLYNEDLFELNKSHFRDVKFIYDRASIIALPHDIRLKYVSWLKSTFPNTPMFVQTIDFNNKELGPPFSIDESMINEYYGKEYNVNSVSTVEFENGAHEEVSSYKGHTFFIVPK